MDTVEIGREKKMNRNYAIFVASTYNYVPYLNALLNSIDKRNLSNNCDLTVYVMWHDEFNKEYLSDIQTSFNYKVVPIEITRSDINMPEETKRIEFIKRARYKKIIELAYDYDVVCLLDADMFVVSDAYINLFDLVNGTEKLIGCNERYKWDIGETYFLGKENIFQTPQKLFNMHCNVPAIFDMKKWAYVFEYYTQLAVYGRQIKNNQVVGIGDLFCWNIAVQKMGMQNRVVLFPIESVAQVHYTNARAWTYMQCVNDYWYTFSGDRVYTIHGRVANKSYREGTIQKFEELQNGMKDMSKIIPKVKDGVKAIQREWGYLNFKHKVNLEKYYTIEDHWKEF
jgi:hypothetical protein